MALGIDKGTTYTKLSNGLRVKSTVRGKRGDEILLNKEVDIFRYNGKEYVIGEDGNYGTDLNKANQLNTIILSLYALAKSAKDNYISENIVTGLPIATFTTNKLSMKSLFHDTRYTVHLNNKEMRIVIKNCEVFPESAGAFFSQAKYKDALVIDIGGLSVDNSLFVNGKLKRFSTYSMGMLKLYSKIANHLNSKYSLDLREWDIPEIINNGLYLYGKYEKIDLSSIYTSHTLEIVERIKLEYDVKSIRTVILVGGGSLLLQKYLQKHFPQVILISNPIFANANGYKQIGDKLWLT